MPESVAVTSLRFYIQEFGHLFDQPYKIDEILIWIGGSSIAGVGSALFYRVIRNGEGVTLSRVLATTVIALFGCFGGLYLTVYIMKSGYIESTVVIWIAWCWITGWVIGWLESMLDPDDQYSDEEGF